MKKNNVSFLRDITIATISSAVGTGVGLSLSYLFAPHSTHSNEAKLESSNKILLADYNRLEADHQALKQNYDRKLVESERLRNAQNNIKMELQTKLVELRTKQMKLDDLETTLATTKKDMEEFLNTKIELQTKQKELVELSKKHEYLKASAARTTLELAKLTKKLEASTATANQAKASQAKASQATNENLEEEINAVINKFKNKKEKENE